MIIQSEGTKINQKQMKTIDAILPVDDVYQAKGKTYAELPFERFPLHQIAYKKQEQKDSKKEEEDLVKKVYKILGIGTKLDLAA